MPNGSLTMPETLNHDLPERCPLCSAGSATLFHQDKRREYYRCGCCHLTFVPREYHLEPAAEKAIYDLHQNSPDDSGYRQFLNRLFEPLKSRLQPGDVGLDFGCGPGPTLSVMFEEIGHTVHLYDPFYNADDSVLTIGYDFVTCTEVVEHFRDPAEDLTKLWACVKPGGLLGIMTKMALGRDKFSRWHYKNDATHVSFSSRKTFEWLAETWNAELTFIGDDVVFFQRDRQD